MDIVEKLKAGETVQFRPKGNSMVPRIKSGQLVTVAPLADTKLKVDDIVLCEVKGKLYLHKIGAMRDKQYQITNNRGYVNGWITKRAIFGRLVKVEN